MSMDFDGALDVIDCGSSASLDNIFAGGGSITSWIYIPTFGELNFGRITHKTETVFSVRNDSTAAGNNAATIRLFRGFGTNGVWTAGANAISTGIWTHVAVTYNSDSTANAPQFYVDGSSKATAQIVRPVGARDDDSAHDLYIGNNAIAGTVAFDGKMEDLRMFAKVITAAEASQLAAGYRGPLGDEVLWPDMEGVDGQVASSNYASIMDKTVYKNNGTPQGSMTYKASKAPRYG